MAYDELPLGKYDKRAIDQGFLDLERLCDLIGSTASQYLSDAYRVETRSKDRVPRFRAKWWCIVQFMDGYDKPRAASDLYGMRPAALWLEIAGARLAVKQTHAQYNTMVPALLASMDIARATGDTAWKKLLAGTPSL